MVDAGFKTKSVLLKNPSSCLGAQCHAVNENVGSIALSGLNFSSTLPTYVTLILKAPIFLFHKSEILGRLK